MISMKRAFGLGVFAVAVLVPVLSSPREALADADDDDDAAEEAKSPDPARVDSSCGALLDKATAGIEKPKADALKAKLGAMRSACAELRSCKSDCRGGKRACVSDCKSKFGRGKQRRECRRSCRVEKRSCKADCRDEAATSGCKDARKAFWGDVGKLVVTTAVDIAKKSVSADLDKTCSTLYTKE